MKIKKQEQAIILAGIDINNMLGNKPNNKNKDGKPIISPPLRVPIDPFSLLSFSIYNEHSVLLTSDGSIMGIGDNRNGQIYSFIKKANYDHLIKFCIKDRSGNQLDPVSAVCCYSGTLYMLSKKKGSERQLVICDSYINRGNPVFLDIGNHHPVTLFGGCSNSAAICSKGEIIFISLNSVMNSPKAKIESVSLPDEEKASSVACCESSIVVLSSNNRVFSSRVSLNGKLEFSEVLELKGKEIVYISGVMEHILTVSKEGRVFGRGSNESGQLGLGKETKKAPSFVEISSLEGYDIKAAYAGVCHSLFETRDGKILSCGFNGNGELLLSSGPGEPVYLPTETAITEGATFCIVGNKLSIVFIDNGQPPNTPNMKIWH